MLLCARPADDAVGAQVEVEVHAKVLAQGCLLPDRCAVAGLLLTMSLHGAPADSAII
jgi:hypothetical protein